MQKQWNLKPLPDDSVVKELSQSINVNPILATLLCQRGVTGYDTAKLFFRPQMDQLHDPFLMKDMDKAVSRLVKAIAENEKMLIYGDYDVDGTTAVSLVYHFLKNQTSTLPENLAYYIPDRYTEGYGISFEGIEYARENGFTLIISLDCGIKSIDKVDYANEKRIDFIICDHHQPGDVLPSAFAVLDPKRKDCAYPFKELSGCGVGFKFMQAYCHVSGIDFSKLHPYLDLLTVSIAADIVPITGENRIFCFHGIKVLNENPRPGLKALTGVSGFKKDLSISNVVFGLAPRINAAGRIAHANAAVDLLLCETEEDARIFADRLNETNLSRKDFDSQITAEAIELIEQQLNHETLVSTVLFKSDWNKGVIGIVASRCIEKHYRPTIILTESNGKAAGSARSVHGFDVHEAISECADLLEQFGGHTYAAGLTLKLENIDAFRQRFEEIVLSRITPDQLIPKTNIDLEVDLDFVSHKTYNILKQMAPYGPGNMTPVFITKNVTDAGTSRIVGDNHLKLNLKQKGHQQTVEAIAFGMGEHLEEVIAGKPFHICYNISENIFNNISTIQLIVKEMKFDLESKEN